MGRRAVRSRRFPVQCLAVSRQGHRDVTRPGGQAPWPTEHGSSAALLAGNEGSEVHPEERETTRQLGEASFHR
jgi:hypothetical protein